MVPAPHTPVLIVGAGPAGATLSLELARYGVAHRIVERATGATDQSRALGLSTRTLELLHRTGAGEAIAGEARALKGFVAYGAGGRKLAELSLSIDPATSRYPSEMVLPQNRTQRLLHEAIERRGGRVEFDKEAVEFASLPERSCVLLRNAQGAQEWVEADWVIGADGANSFMRRITGDNFVGMEYEEKFLLADVSLRWPLSDQDAHLFLRAGGPIVAFPYPYPGRWRLIDTSNEAETGEQGPTIERFKQLFGEFVSDMEIEEAGWTSLFKIHRRLVDRYRIGRVILMGDAAHIHSPASGQGLNTGVQDAINLAWKLALVVHGHSPHTLLDSYMPERRPVAEGVLSDSHKITEMVLAKNPVVQHVRDAILHFALGFDGVQRRLAAGISKVGTNYRGSPIVEEAEHGGGDAPRAGDRLPDPEVKSGRRLSDVVSDGLAHHLLVVGADPAPLAAEIDRRDLGEMVKVLTIDAELLDPDAKLRKVLGVRQNPAAFLVRPDLYLGFVGSAKRLDDLAEPFGVALDSVFNAARGAVRNH